MTRDRPEDSLIQNRVEDDHLHHVLDRLVAFAALLTPDGRLKDVSQNALTAGGLSFDDVAGRLFWDCYWWSHDALVQDRLKTALATAACGGTVRYDEIVRIENEGRLYIDFQLSPVLNSSGRVTEIVASATDISDRVAAQRDQELLVREMSHRIKNILSTVRAMAGLTRRTALPERAFDDFIARVDALAALHDILNRSRDADTFFVELVEHVLGPYLTGRHERFSIRGPHRLLQRDQAKLLGLCINELATNAAKYGALSGATGRVDVQLSLTDTGAGFSWRESGGPPAVSPARSGFGSIFVRETLASIFGAIPEVHYGADGFSIAVAGTEAVLFSTPA